MGKRVASRAGPGPQPTTERSRARGPSSSLLRPPLQCLPARCLGRPPKCCLPRGALRGLAWWAEALCSPHSGYLGARQGLGWWPFFSVPLSSTAPLQAWVGAPTPPTLQGPVQAYNPDIRKTGWPQELETQEIPGAQGPTASGGLQGADPLLIYATPPCSLCPKLLSSHLSQGPGIPAELVAGPLVSMCIYN